MENRNIPVILNLCDDFSAGYAGEKQLNEMIEKSVSVCAFSGGDYRYQNRCRNLWIFIFTDDCGAVESGFQDGG